MTGVPKKQDINFRSYRLGLSVISLVKSFSNNVSSKVIAAQVIRSATSIGANLAESKASTSRREYKKYYEIALKSANETVYWLTLAKDANLVNDERINSLIGETKEVASMLGRGVITLKKPLL